jgi:hypothetical protein
MGLLDKFRSSKTKGPVSPMPSQLPPPMVELSPKVLAAVTKCHQTGRDVGVATQGEGNELSITVAGTNHRQEAMRYVSQMVGGAGEKPVAAVVLREPTNVFDNDAIRVLVDGVHIGFLPRDDAPPWQSVLQECERRGFLLVGSVRLLPPDSRGELSAVIGLRDGLPGFAGQVIAKRAAARAAAERAAKAKEAADLAHADARAAAARPMTDVERNAVIQTLTRLMNEDNVRTKAKATAIVKQLRKLFPLLHGHVEAAEQAADGVKHLPISDAFSVVEDAADTLVDDPEDADEREDLYWELSLALDDLLKVLDAAPRTPTV